jgi:hypothetical protein
MYYDPDNSRSCAVHDRDLSCKVSILLQTIYPQSDRKWYSDSTRSHVLVRASMNRMKTTAFSLQSLESAHP